MTRVSIDAMRTDVKVEAEEIIYLNGLLEWAARKVFKLKNLMNGMIGFLSDEKFILGSFEKTGHLRKKNRLEKGRLD